MLPCVGLGAFHRTLACTARLLSRAEGRRQKGRQGRDEGGEQNARRSSPTSPHRGRSICAGGHFPHINNPWSSRAARDWDEIGTGNTFPPPAPRWKAGQVSWCSRVPAKLCTSKKKHFTSKKRPRRGALAAAPASTPSFFKEKVRNKAQSQ